MQFGHHSSGGYVLLLDDEPAVRESLGRFLERSGYTVRGARSVDEALKAIGPEMKAAILDVVLVNSKGRSGLDVLIAIRQLPRGADIPVLMFTGYGLSPNVVSAIEEQRTELLHKPVSPSDLVAWLEGRGVPVKVS